jgi:hypothetical protein
MIAKYDLILVSDFGQHTLTTLDEWTSVLHLASKWGFESMRSLALRELLPLASPVDKIVLGRKYGFDDWLTPAFVAVCARAEPLSLAEAKRMDIDDVARIYLAREQARDSSMIIAVEMAQKAVACVFGIKEEGAVTSNPDMDDFTHDKISTTNDLAHCHHSSYAREVLSEHVATDLLADNVEVDDDLMEALATWSRISSRLHQYPGFRYSPIDPHNQRGCQNHSLYMEHRADYESLLKYVGGPQLQATSLRRFLSVILQSDLHRKRATFCIELFTDLRNRMNEELPGSAGISTHNPVGKAEFTHMVNELCLELIGYECTLDDTTRPFNCRQRPARLVTNLSNADLLTGTTWRACFSYLVPLPAHPDFYLLQDMCTFLVNHGKNLDRESCRDLMNDVFLRLRKHAIEWRFQSVRQDIIVSAPSLFRRTRAHLTVSDLGCFPS